MVGAAGLTISGTGLSFRMGLMLAPAPGPVGLRGASVLVFFTSSATVPSSLFGPGVVTISLSASCNSVKLGTSSSAGNCLKNNISIH